MFTPLPPRGFTLVELAVVLLVIGVLSGIVLRNIGSQGIQARDVKRVSDLRNVSVYVTQYLSRLGQFPSVSDIKWRDGEGLEKALRDVNVLVGELPTPPGQASSSYEYYACSDQNSAPPNGITNHIIFATTLEEKQAENPQLYENSFNSANPPNSWDCASPAGQSALPVNLCGANNHRYCIVD